RQRMLCRGLTGTEPAAADLRRGFEVRHSKRNLGRGPVRDAENLVRPTDGDGIVEQPSDLERLEASSRMRRRVARAADDRAQADERPDAPQRWLAIRREGSFEPRAALDEMAVPEPVDPQVVSQLERGGRVAGDRTLKRGSDIVDVGTEPPEGVEPAVPGLAWGRESRQLDRPPLVGRGDRLRFARFGE